MKFTNICASILLFIIANSVYADVTISIVNKTGHRIRPKIHQYVSNSWSWTHCGTPWEQFVDSIPATQTDPVLFEIGNIWGCTHADVYWFDFEIRDVRYPFPMIESNIHCTLPDEDQSAQVTAAVNEDGSYSFEWVCPA